MDAAPADDAAEAPAAEQDAVEKIVNAVVDAISQETGVDIEVEGEAGADAGGEWKWTWRADDDDVGYAWRRPLDGDEGRRSCQ